MAASTRSAGVLKGAGSSLVAPAVAAWGQLYKADTVQYSPIGSGGGIAQISNGANNVFVRLNPDGSNDENFGQGGLVLNQTMPDQDFGGMTYTVLMLGENGIGGMMPMTDEVPAEVPAFWLTVFEVADVDATAARIPELGGNVASPPSDIPNIGRFAVAADPQGAMFGVITSAPQQA